MRWLLRLYPRAWRERYGQEFAALLDDQQFSMGLVFDVVTGALDARLSALRGGISGMHAAGALRVAIAAAILATATVISGLGSQSWGEQVDPCTDYLNRVTVDASGRVLRPVDLQVSDAVYRCWQAP